MSTKIFWNPENTKKVNSKDIQNKMVHNYIIQRYIIQHIFSTGNTPEIVVIDPDKDYDELITKIKGELQ